MVEPEESGGGQVGQGGAHRARRETEQPKVPASGSSGIAPGMSVVIDYQFLPAEKKKKFPFEYYISTGRVRGTAVRRESA
ncbi:hypothetical protein Trydic_g10507 [Trypoxylus dichotomus]